MQASALSQWGQLKKFAGELKMKEGWAGGGENGKGFLLPIVFDSEKICERLFSHNVNYLHIFMTAYLSPGVGIPFIGEDVFLSVLFRPFL